MTVWIRSAAELARLVSSLERGRALALDTESDSLHHHREKVCLIQLATEQEQGYLVDPLALPELGSLGPVLSDPRIVKVFHGADYDVTTLKRDFGFQIQGLFDTMIAARFLGLPEVGLQAVLRAQLGVEVSKDSQKDDWSRRPLTSVQEAYALDDVRHLLALHDRLTAQLQERGRLAWVQEECAAVAALEAARKSADPEAYLRIKGARALPPRQQAVLRELVAWRESLAVATDIPAFKLVSPDVLLALAASPPHRPEELARVRGLTPRMRQRAPELLAAVERARALPDSALPRPSATPRPTVSAATRRRTEALRAWRKEAAVRLGLDVSVVLPQRLLDRVAEAAPADAEALAGIEGLRKWRVEALGPEILAVLRRG